MYQNIYQPQPEHTARKMGSGGLDVLATPALVAFMENLAYEFLEDKLETGQSSVGTRMDIQHLAASLIDQSVCVCITDWQKEGRKHTFTLQASVDDKVTATAHHTRFVVDVESFLGKLK